MNVNVSLMCKKCGYEATGMNDLMFHSFKPHTDLMQGVDCWMCEEEQSHYHSREGDKQ